MQHKPSSKDLFLLYFSKCVFMFSLVGCRVYLATSRCVFTGKTPEKDFSLVY